MNISGVLVHVQPKRMDALCEELNATEGVEVHAATDGKLVVTVENEKLNALADQVMAFQHLKGVMSVAMVYHESDDNENVNIEEILAEVTPACTVNTCNEQPSQEAS
ncbi:MAG: chaperone NapD [Woeseiaceae bacterium]